MLLAVRPLRVLSWTAVLVAASLNVTEAKQATAPRLSPCTVGQGPGTSAAECGVLTVFENRQARRGRTIDIHYAVIRANQQPAREALVMFAGGPGESSILVMGSVGWNRTVRSTMDILLVEQRGTGQSHPLDCEPPQSADPASSFGHLFDPDRVRVCRAKLEAGADLTQYTTDAAVEDLEAVRALLGYEKVSLYGASYGTRLAQAYMRRYPNRVKGAVLDGTVPFDNELPVTYAASAQQSLDRVFAACAADSTCHSAHATLGADFSSLLHRFDAGTVATTVAAGGPPIPVQMSKGDFGYTVRGFLYGAKAVGSLPDLISRAASTGDLHEFAQVYLARVGTFSHDFSDGLHWSVLCPEDVDFVTDAGADAATAKTFLGRYVIDEYRRACGLWPRATVAGDFRTPVTVKVPTLLVAGYFDPVTPPEFAERIARSLPLARVVVAPTGAHVSGSGCPRAAVLHVLINGTFDGMPTVCR